MTLVGIVGKSNTGKSTFFKAATLIDVEISNRIFTTLKPNQGVGYVLSKCPCKEFGVSCSPRNSKCVNGIRFIPITIVDIAGLVPEAHKGKGLGNKFLSDIMEASALIHVIDCSGGTDDEGNPVMLGTHDPEKDIEFLPKEIDYWILEILTKNWTNIKKKAEVTKEKIEDLIHKQLSGLQMTHETIKQAVKELGITMDSDEGELLELIGYVREIDKPILIAANKIDLKEAQNNFEVLREKYRDIIPCSAESELALREAAEHDMIDYIPGDKRFDMISDRLSERQINALEFIRKSVLERYGSTGVQQALNKAVFDILRMIVVYPVANMNKLSDKSGNILPDAFLVKKGTKLKEFAFKIHKEIGEHFIGGLDISKKKIGAEYELKNGDIVEILVRR